MSNPGDVGPHEPEGGEPRRCGARTRAGGTCRRLSMAGQARCDFHGGKSPQALRKAEVRLAEQRINQRLGKLGVEVPEDADPLGILSLALGVALGDFQAMREVVGDVEPTDPTNPVVRLYGETLDRAGALAKEAARLNLDERLAEYNSRVTARQADIMRQGLEAYRQAAGVTSADHERGVRAMAAVIRGEDTTRRLEAGDAA